VSAFLNQSDEANDCSGGNNPTIVCEGIDVAKTAQEIVKDVMRNCGQVRVAADS
jgi:acyl-CoA reductase-like NAD-dependent aldehyde dehydrogenase